MTRGSLIYNILKELKNKLIHLPNKLYIQYNLITDTKGPMEVVYYIQSML